VREIDKSVVSSSFLIAIICQIKELVLDDLGLCVNNSRSGKPIKKVNQRVNRFHTSVLPDTHHKMRVCLTDFSTAQQSSTRLARSCRGPGQGATSVVIKREPNLRILRFINEVLPVFRGSGSLPA